MEQPACWRRVIAPQNLSWTSQGEPRAGGRLRVWGLPAPALPPLVTTASTCGTRILYRLYLFNVELTAINAVREAVSFLPRCGPFAAPRRPGRRPAPRCCRATGQGAVSPSPRRGPRRHKQAPRRRGGAAVGPRPHVGAAAATGTRAGSLGGSPVLGGSSGSSGRDGGERR